MLTNASTYKRQLAITYFNLSSRLHKCFKMNNRNKIRFDIIILQLSTCIFCPSKNNSLVGKAKSERCEVVIVFVFCVEGLAPQTTGRS